MLIHINSAFKYTQKNYNSAYLTVIPLILISDGVW